MRSLGLIIIVLTASLIVFVECQKDQKCSNTQDCESGCCFQGNCSTDEFLCQFKKEEEKVEEQCFSDFGCSVGCCVNYKCKPKSSFECIKKNSCTTNSDCDSNCCKNNQCSSVHLFCFTFPKYKRKDDKCSSSTDCYTSSRGSCCVGGSCTTCAQNFHDYGGSSTHSSGGTSVGIVIGVVFLLIIKLVIWISWCSRRHRRRVVVVRRQVACPAVPIVQNDEREREHDGVEQGIPDRPPPAYSPTPERHINSTLTTGQTLHQEEGIVNTSYEGEPPPAYDLNPASENANSVQTDVTGTIEHVNPPPYSVATNQHMAQSSPSIPNHCGYQ